MRAEHLGVALELRVEIDRLMALYERLSQGSEEIVVAKYQEVVLESINLLVKAESKALYQNRIACRGD